MLPNIIIMSSKSKSKSKRSALITLVLFSRVTPFDMKRRPKSKIYKAQRMSSSVLFWHNHETHGINQGTCTAVLFQKTLVYPYMFRWTKSLKKVLKKGLKKVTELKKVMKLKKGLKKVNSLKKALKKVMNSKKNSKK